MTEPHTHPEIEDRITAEMALVRTEILALRVDTARGFDALRHDMRRGFTDMTQVLEQILARLSENDGPGPVGEG